MVIAVLVGFVATLNRPWLEQWGSTAAERSELLAGDDIVAAPSAVYTRSISIAAPPAEIWPWLLQMGQDKGGFYSFDWAETLFTDPMRNAMAIRPEWQQLQVGDLIHPFPPDRGLPSWRVRHLEPQRSLVVATDDDTWSLAFQLRPVGADGTRVVTRLRSEPNWMNVALGPADLIVFPRLLVGLQQRAEGTLPGMPGVPVGAPLPTARLPVQWWAALLWVAALALLGAVGGRVLGVGGWRRPRPHPGITIAIAFVLGSGYAIMSDTPPSQFLARSWLIGLPLAALLAVAASRTIPGERSSWLRRSGRAVVAIAEAGMFVVVPATVIWQAATATGATQTLTGRTAASVLAVTAAVAIAAIAIRAAHGNPHQLVIITVAAAGYVITGSALVPLLGAALLEVFPTPAATRTSVTVARTRSDQDAGSLVHN